MGLAIAVECHYAEYVKNLLVDQGVLDDRWKIWHRPERVVFPVTEVPSLDVAFEVIETESGRTRKKTITPFEMVQQQLSGRIPTDDFNRLPWKWEKFGDVVILKLSGISDKKTVASAYARVLGCKTVLEDVTGISGVTRQPGIERVYGSDTETTHVENGIQYMFDAARIMFSSGNVDERVRMAKVADETETVVDMFAGIGYFTLPIAVHGNAQVYACEINPVAHAYLEKNCALNTVTEQVTPLFGDCRTVAPRGVADRIIMGYFDAPAFLPHAFTVLRKEGGDLHLHVKCGAESFPDDVIAQVHATARRHRKRAEVLYHRVIKSYAPHIVHGVVDLRVS